VRDPTTVMGGQYSLPFTAAVALTRDMSNPLVYNDEAVRDPLVRKLAQEMGLIVDERVHDLFPAEVEIACGTTRYRRVTSAHKGSPHNPMTWDDVCEKFNRYTRSLIDASQAHAIIDAVGDLQNQSDMARVAALLAKQH
jgi:2-methylcitrate dehydratase PrpD